jgi:hypothetical protein
MCSRFAWEVDRATDNGDVLEPASRSTLCWSGSTADPHRCRMNGPRDRFRRALRITPKWPHNGQRYGHPGHVSRRLRVCSSPPNDYN